MSETQPEPSDEQIQQIVKNLLKKHPNGFSVSPEGDVTPDREAIEITSIEQFAKIAREPKTIVIDLYAGKTVSFKVRPLDVNEQREIDALDNEAPTPPKKARTPSPSLAKSRDVGPEEYDYRDTDYLRKMDEHLERKRTATIVKGLVEIEIPGDTLETQQKFLSERFPPRILDAVFASIRSLTTDTIERALFR